VVELGVFIGVGSLTEVTVAFTVIVHFEVIQSTELPQSMVFLSPLALLSCYPSHHLLEPFLRHILFEFLGQLLLHYQPLYVLPQLGLTFDYLHRVG